MSDKNALLNNRKSLTCARNHRSEREQAANVPELVDRTHRVRCCGQFR